jgi:hypothetical protein
MNEIRQHYMDTPHALSEARKSCGAQSRRALFAAFGLIVYITVGSATAMHLASSSQWTVELDTPTRVDPGQKPDDPRRDLQNPEELSPAQKVIGISVEPPADCAMYCESFSVHCITTNDLIGSDWILILATEFDQVYQQLGCNAAATEAL